MDIESRGIRRGEELEKDLDALIRRRHDDERVATEGERPAEEAWAESERRYAQKRNAQRRAEWAAYHQTQAERHRATLTDLIAHHQTQAAKYTDKNGHHNEEADQAND